MAGGSGTLTPQQQQVVAAAEQQAAAQGKTGNEAQAIVQAALQQSGAFSAAQLGGLSNDGISGTGQFTPGNIPDSTWNAQITGALNGGAQAGTGAGVAASVLNPSDIAGTAPVQYSQFGSLPVVAPSTYNASHYTSTGYTPAQYGATNVSTAGSLLDPTQNQSYLDKNMQLIQTSMNPAFDQENQSLDAQLAGRGILNSGAGAQAAILQKGQQDAAVAAAQQPLVSQGYSYEQGDLTQNASTNFAANQADAQYQNIADAANAQALNTGGQFDASALNAAGQFNAGSDNTANAGNTASTNAINEYNANNYMGTTTNDEAAYNAWLAARAASGDQYGAGQVTGYEGTAAPANSSVLGGIQQGANNAGTAGANAYGGVLAGSGGVGAALGSVANQLVKPTTAPSTTNPTTGLPNSYNFDVPGA